MVDVCFAEGGAVGGQNGSAPAIRPDRSSPAFRLAGGLAEQRGLPLSWDGNLTRESRLAWIGDAGAVPAGRYQEIGMSQLVVLGFDGISAASEVLNKVRSLKAQHLVELEDAVVVERDVDGVVHIKQAVNLTRLGAASGGLSGAFWGMLVGLLFLNPLAGMAIGAGAGAGAGALSGSLMDYGVNDDFVKKLAETIPNNSSALFVLVRDATMDKVVAEIQQWNPRVLNTNLTGEQEAKLVKALKAL